jgi:hypothetical protein
MFHQKKLQHRRQIGSALHCAELHETAQIFHDHSQNGALPAMGIEQIARKDRMMPGAWRDVRNLPIGSEARAHHPLVNQNHCEFSRF